MSTPKLSIALPCFGEGDRAPTASWLYAAIDAAELSGFDRVVVSDHVVFTDDLDEYTKPEAGGRQGGRQPTGPDGLWLEPLTVLAMAAARTTRVRLATTILLAALRRPVILAKTTATLDYLSGGRVDLGVGVGWQRAEYEASGLDFAGRGRALDQSLEVCRRLWEQDVTSFEGDGLAFENVHMMPKPVQKPLPLWISGTLNPAVVRRLSRYGAAWIPWGDDAANLGTSIPSMRRLVEETGRDAAAIGVAARISAKRSPDGGVDAAATAEKAARLVDLGVTDIVVAPVLPLNHEDMAVQMKNLVEAFWRTYSG
ncbi:TIGR03619 family F420-dependent LLM class oxidoreductase [Rhodococcus sp. 5G237]